MHHKVVAQLCAVCELAELHIGLGLAHGVGSALDARFIAKLGGGYLGIDVLAQLGRWKRNLLAQLLGQGFGFLIKHHQHQQAGPAVCKAGAHFLVAQQIIIHVLDGFELMRAMLARHGYFWMGAIKAIEEIDVFELVDPAAQPQDVIGGWRQKGDGCLVLPEKSIDFRKACQFGFFCCFCHSYSPQDHLWNRVKPKKWN